MDNWDNLKIPRLKELEGYSPDRPMNEWTYISLSENVTWSSLVGTMLDTPAAATGTTLHFPIEATYFDLDCTNRFSTTAYSELERHLGPLYVGFNTSIPSNSSAATPLFYLRQGDLEALGFDNFLLGLPLRSPPTTDVPKQITLKYAARAFDPSNASINTF